MRSLVGLSSLLLSFVLMSAPPVDAASRKNSAANSRGIATSTFTPFTGKVNGNRVRLRLEPNVDCRVIKEMENGNLLQIVDENEGFYCVRPPEEMSAFVYRNYVSDDTIDGTHVNIRLGPNLDAPILTQLDTGDKVQGVTAQEGSKWLKINVPSQVCFYVAKEYIDSIGDINFIAEQNRRTKYAQELIQTAFNSSQEELRKPFEEIDLKETMAAFDTVINSYADIEKEASHATELEKVVNDAYTQKKIAYLESKASKSKTSNEALDNALQSYYSRLSQLETMLKEDKVQETNEVNIEETIAESNSEEIAEPISVENIIVENDDYNPIEEALFANWSNDASGTPTIDDFYLEQKKEAVTIQGTLESYDRPVKYKPGNFIVVNEDKTPVAFIYSTQVDLKDKVGKEVSITATPRSNNNFAFPAYYALAAE